MRKNLFTLFLFVTLLLPSAAFAQTVNISAAERKMAETINADQLSNWLHFVASDAMAGRDTPSQGLDVTAEFLKMKLSWWKFKPAGDDGTFFQKIKMSTERVDPENSSLKLGRTPFTINDDFYRIAGSGTATGEMVFADHGWLVKGKNIDAFDGIDVKGKIVVLKGSSFPNANNLTRRPEGVTNADLSGTRGTDWADPLTHARAKGAAGVIIIAAPDQMNSWEQIRGFMNREATTMVGLRESVDIPVIMTSDKLNGHIFAGGRGSIESAKAFATGNEAEIIVQTTARIRMTQNVVALWEGGDAKLKHEMIAIGAHYDHVGVNENAQGDDKIWNGADDDGSGTVAMLAIAEALAKAGQRPKRSILFVWHTGEEKGLLGAEYFNKYPTVNIKDVVAQLNIDMIGRSQDPDNIIKCDTPRRPCNEDLSKANEVYVIGTEMMSSTLGAVTKGTNDAFLKLDYNYRYDAPDDPNRFFFRSDHFHYAVNGIPVVFWFTGVHEDYHQPGDHPDKIDYQKYETITRTIFMTAWKLSELNERPAVDKQLPPELQRR